MDKTLLKQKIAEWGKACEYFASPDIQKQLADEEKSAIKFLVEFWKNNEFDKATCEKHINTLKECDKLHSSNRDIIEKSKNFRGIAATFYTKDAQTFHEFRTEMGWTRQTPTPVPTPTPTPTPTPQHNEAMMMINVEKWSKAIQYLRSEEITPLLDVNEFTAIEQLADMWRRPSYQPTMKEEAAEMIKVLVDSHKLHSSNREIIEKSKSLCGVARKVYDNKETFDAFKKAITQYYKENKPPKKEPVPDPKKETPKKTPTPTKQDKELILQDVVFANTTYNNDIIKDFGKTLFTDTQYITPRITVSSEYYGTETIEVKLRYPNGETAQYEDEIVFKGKGNYIISGWGSKTGSSYASYSYVEYTFICRGKKLWQGRVTIKQDPKKLPYPNIVDIKFGATDYDGNIVVEHGNPIPTGIPYLSPMIVVDNNFRGSITLDIEYKYEKRGTNKTSCEVYIQGPGEYSLSGWGRKDCGFYTEPETIKCTISYDGKTLYSKSVKIGKGGSPRRETRRRNSDGKESGWTLFKNKIEDVGDWFEDKTEDPESVTSIISALIFILYVILVIGIWISEGFWSALLVGGIGFFVTGFVILASNFVTKVILHILRFVFLNVWTFLIAVIIFLAQIIIPALTSFGSGLFSNIGDMFDKKNKTEMVVPETLPYICTAKSGVNVRQSPSSSAAQVGALLYGQQIEVYETNGDFARIKFDHKNGNDAWVSSKYIQIDEDAFFAQNEQRKGVKTLSSGVQYEVIKKGKGDKPQASDIVKCNYTMTLVDGTFLDGTTSSSGPISFDVDKVIAGWSDALTNMKEGAQWKLYIPSHLAFGEKGNSMLAPNTPLVCEVELVEIVENI